MKRNWLYADTAWKNQCSVTHNEGILPLGNGVFTNKSLAKNLFSLMIIRTMIFIFMVVFTLVTFCDTLIDKLFKMILKHILNGNIFFFLVWEANLVAIYKKDDKQQWIKFDQRHSYQCAAFQ